MYAYLLSCGTALEGSGFLPKQLETHAIRTRQYGAIFLALQFFQYPPSLKIFPLRRILQLPAILEQQGVRQMVFRNWLSSVA